MTLKPLWPDPGTPTPDPGGDGVTQRGSDPNADGGGGPAGLQDHWPQAVMSAPSGAESANSVSGLPPVPARTQPSEAPPDPPSLQDRMPGTIDQR